MASSSGGTLTTVMSRRRMAFRPPQDTPGQPALLKSTAGGSLKPTDSTKDDDGTRPGRRWETWMGPEQSAFYDAIKQVGKDYEAIARIMVKRKLKKDKEQIRNYYYNTYKLLKATAQLTEELLGDIPREAKELFVLINGFEWRKRTMGAKFEPSKLRQLILEGSTSLRLKKKKTPVVIKTPVCPILNKFCPSKGGNSAELPTTFNVELVPHTTRSHRYVIEQMQNPLLRVRAPLSEPIAGLFDLLQRKWCTSDESESTRTACIRLRAEEHANIARVVVRPMQLAPLLSLNMCKKRGHVNPPRVEDATVSSALDPDAQSGGAHACRVGEPVAGPVSVAAASEEVLIDERILREGFTRDAVAQANFIELYYLFGKKSTIRLEYEITRCESRSDFEPWTLFLSLLSRNYGDDLCKAATRVDAATTATTRPRLAIASGNGGKRVAVEQSLPTMRESGQCAMQDVVTSESRAFLQQMSELGARRRRGAAVASSSVAVLPAVARPLTSTQARSATGGRGENASTVVTAQCSTDARREIASASPALDFASLSRAADDWSQCSPHKTNASLPDDVRESLEAMMQQNSIDYCRHFEQLASTLETTPQKHDNAKSTLPS